MHAGGDHDQQPEHQVKQEGEKTDQKPLALAWHKFMLHMSAQLVGLKITGVLHRAVKPAAQAMLPKRMQQRAREGQRFHDHIKDPHATSPSPFKKISSTVSFPAL